MWGLINMKDKRKTNLKSLFQKFAELNEEDKVKDGASDYTSEKKDLQDSDNSDSSDYEEIDEMLEKIRSLESQIAKSEKLGNADRSSQEVSEEMEKESAISDMVRQAVTGEFNNTELEKIATMVTMATLKELLK